MKFKTAIFLVLAAVSQAQAQPVTFAPDFCGSNLEQTSPTQIETICYGLAEFEDMRFRAVEIQFAGGEVPRELLIEKAWERLDSTRLKIRAFLFGPVGEKRETEFITTANPDGEIEAVEGKSIRAGDFKIQR